jgi:hypothetical protein
MRQKKTPFNKDIIQKITSFNHCNASLLINHFTHTHLNRKLALCQGFIKVNRRKIHKHVLFSFKTLLYFCTYTYLKHQKLLNNWILIEHRVCAMQSKDQISKIKNSFFVYTNILL